MWSDKKVIFITFEKSFSTWKYMGNWSDKTFDYVKVVPITNAIGAKALFQRARIVKLKKGDFPPLEKFSDGATITLRNYKDTGEYVSGRDDVDQQREEIKNLKTIIDNKTREIERLQTELDRINASFEQYEERIETKVDKRLDKILKKKEDMM